MPKRAVLLVNLGSPDLPSVDHVLFSCYGVPVRHLRKAGCTHAHSARATDCRPPGSSERATCCRSQVLATTRALAARAGLAAGGASFRQIPCLNDQAPYINFLAGQIERWVATRDASPVAPQIDALNFSRS